MTKKEIYQNIFEDMMREGILNMADAYNLSFLQEEVEQIIGSIWRIMYLYIKQQL